MSVKMNTLYTIGHSDYVAGQLVSLLRLHGVEAVADVRSNPYSQRLPQFNRPALEATLESAKMHYVFLGKELGARREELECYSKGRADYGLIARTASFQEGLNRLQHGLLKMRIALLCAEHDPLTCHRTILVCRHLRAKCSSIQHILRDGRLESHQETEIRMIRALGSGNGIITPLIIEQAYDLQGQRISYTDECVGACVCDEQIEMHLK